MNKRSFLTAIVAAALPGLLPGQETKAKRINFKPGTTESVITGKLTGRESLQYKLNAKEKQWLQVQVLPKGKGADYNIYIPGRGPGDEALFNSLSGGRSYLGQLYKTGDHTIDVFLNRAAARRGDTSEYAIVVRVTDKKPPEEEKPSSNPVPQKVIDDCLQALRKQLQTKDMKVIKARRGETSFIIDVRVPGVPKPWRCFHDGSKVTGTEYQGEG